MAKNRSAIGASSAPHQPDDLVADVGGWRRPLDDLARFAQRSRRRVDRERGLVAEQVPDHRRQHERERRIDRRHADDVGGGGEPGLALGGDHDRQRLVGPEDRDLLGDVVGGATDETGRAHQDQRLARQVDVLLVLGDVAGDALVAELAELDPHLFGGDRVDAVADDGPVPTLRREPLGGIGDVVAHAEHGAHRVGDLAQRLQQLVPACGAAEPGGLG